MGKQVDTTQNFVTKREFEDLAKKLDENLDGIVTHEEIKRYTEAQLAQKESYVQFWRNKYLTLKAELENSEFDPNEKKENHISERLLEDYVDKVLQTDTNLAFVPDSIERQMYLTFYRTVLNSLENFIETTKIDLLNHRISLHIEPISS